jgi:M6 family metalloprotease-like protein
MSFRNRRLVIGLALFISLIAGLIGTISVTTAQDAPTVPSPKTESVQLTGWLHITTGDPEDPTTTPSIDLITLQDDQSQTIAVLETPTERARAYYGQYVTVTGNFDATRAGESRLVVAQIAPSGQARDGGLRDLRAVSGAQPWVNLLCRFAGNSSEPKTVSYFESLFNNTYPGLDHYWRQLSYNTINIVGTVTQPWRSLPQPRSYYVTTNPSGSSTANLDRLFNDCTAAHDPFVNFPPFVGINMMFNDNLDCCAWGGSRTLTADSQTKTYRSTWNPPWAHVHSVLAHEMGHGYGFPHSTGPLNSPPTGLSIYVSQWDVMSDSTGTCAVNNTTFGCPAPGTISYNLRNAGWIPSNRIVTVASGTQTVTLERTVEPSNTTNTRMIVVPIANSSTRYYTVEARNIGAGYDQNIPASAVVIHSVDTARGGNGGPAYVVDADTNNTDTNDAGARWLPGETFANSTDGVTIEVLSQSGSTFSVRVTNSAPPPPPPPANDAFANAVAMTPPTTQTQNNIGDATTASDDPAMCTPRSSTVWYKFTLGSATTVNLNTVGSNYDTVLGVYTGTAGNLTQVACNDDSGGGVTSAVSFNAAAGTTYYVLVAQYNTGGAASNASLTLNFSSNAPANLIKNGSFAAGMNFWGTFDAITHRIQNGRLEFSRNVGGASAVVLQDTQMPLPSDAVLEVTFDMGNASNLRKRFVVLVHNANFNDLNACSFWIPPNTAPRTYTIRTASTVAWASAVLSFYASNADGVGWYQLDNVSMVYRADLTPAETVCVDAGAPPPGAGSNSQNALQNASFTSPIGSANGNWGVFASPSLSDIVHQITGSVFEFYRKSTGASAVVLQNTTLAVPINTPIEATFRLGNSTSVRQRATILLHATNFSDLQFCTFYIEPNTPLGVYTMRTYATQAWATASISIYASTSWTGGGGFIRLDDVTLRTRPSMTVTGTQCYEPGVTVPLEAGRDEPSNDVIAPPLLSTALPYLAPAMPFEQPLIAPPAPPTESTMGEGTVSE